MKNWQAKYPPYEGREPYLYFAFADNDTARVWPIMRILLERGCRVWYSLGAAGSAEEFLHRQEQAKNAALSLLFLTDAALADNDTKTNILVNQKLRRPPLCLDSDGKDRYPAMGLRETVPRIPLKDLSRDDWETAILHAEGFSQELLGEPLTIKESTFTRKLSALFLALAVILSIAAFVEVRYLHLFAPEAAQDEVVFSDPVLLAAVREAAGSPVTEEAAAGITYLRLTELPESWDELIYLPSLERIEIPQEALLDGGELPEGGYIIELKGGGS